MKNKITKKQIQGKISDSVSLAISQLEVKDPSKKVKRVIKRASKMIASKVSRQLKHEVVVAKKGKTGRSPKPSAKKKTKGVEVAG